MASVDAEVGKAKVALAVEMGSRRGGGKSLDIGGGRG